MANPVKRERTLRALTVKLEAKALRLIRQRLRVLEKNSGINYVAFRLGITYEQARALLDGEKRLTLERVSDLALAVGCTIDAKLKRAAARKGRRNNG